MDAGPVNRLTATTLPRWRQETLAAQGGVCAVCGRPVTDKDPAVADHEHTTGLMRGVLHRSCNSLLGVLENNRVRYGMRDTVQFTKFLHGIVPYLGRIRPDAPTYPTYRTADEKRELRNKRARRARAAVKRGA